MFDPRRLFGGGGGRVPAARAALERDPALRMALAALAHGRAAEALATFDRVLDEERLELEVEAEVRSKRGVALVVLGRRGQALESFATALACDEACAPALVNLGNLLFEDGAILDAIDFYRAAVAVDDGYAPAYRGLGIAFKALGRRGDAVRAFKAEARKSARRAP